MSLKTSLKTFKKTKRKKALILKLKMELTLTNKLSDSSIFEYNPKWVKNLPKEGHIKEKLEENQQKKEKIGWHNFYGYVILFIRTISVNSKTF